MKVLFFLVVLAALVATAVFKWRKNHRPPATTPTEQTGIAQAPVIGPDLSPRPWTNQEGRSFEGSLVSAKNGQVILQRASDSSYFQLPASALSENDRAFVEEQTRLADSGGSGFAKEIPGLHTLSRKLDIKGGLLRVPAPALGGGWQNIRSEPTFWFLLSPQLHGADAGSLWARVDEKTFKAHTEGALLNKSALAAFMKDDGTFTESMPWPKPGVTLIEAQYGPHAAGNNVTHALMLLASQNRLPVELAPDLFALPAHAPELWELSVRWRTPTGEVRRALRDGAAITWP